MPVPTYAILTDASGEQVNEIIPVYRAELRFTCPGLRGLFGGLWRPGLTFFVEGMGKCFGPQVYYPVGANDREARAAFGRTRARVLQEEARAARAAYGFVRRITAGLGGRVVLDLVTASGDRHTLHTFLPMDNVIRRFSPQDWFDFWRRKNVEFQSRHKRSRGDSPGREDSGPGERR